MDPKLTVGFYFSAIALDNFTQVRPACEVLQIEADVVRLGQVVEIAGVESEQVRRGHGPYVGHSEDGEIVVS